MAPPQPNPALQKPPGYKDPNQPAQPVPKSAPPRKPVLPPSFQLKAPRQGCCRKCCCVFCVIILVLIFALTVALALVYLVYDPQPPVFRLQSFRVPRLNVTNKPEGAYLDANTVTRVEVKNPNNRMTWYFDDTSCEISADNGNLDLGKNTLPAFTLKENEVQNLKVETSVQGQPLNDAQGKNLKDQMQSREIVPSVLVRTKAGVGLQGWKMGRLGINVVCGDVSLKNLEGGATPKCTIILLRWIKIH